MDSICELVINTDKHNGLCPGTNFYAARHHIACAAGEPDAPSVSVVVPAYNNLEKYTKTCVECVLKYSGDLNYELILVDNGSTDETLVYFKTVPHPRKKIVKITKNLGALFGSNIGINLAAGRFIAIVYNDIYVTNNWLNNMLTCMLSDDKIGMIVPVSDHVSNMQHVDLGYSDFHDMQEKAAKFNRSDPRKWHERLRLAPPITFLRRECIDMMGMHDYGFFHDFADDDLTFRVRRAGYKAVLCKDVFVQHAGHTVMKNPEEYSESLEKGRLAFREKYHGLDAWDDVNNYEPTMMSYITVKEEFKSQRPQVLGVDVLCGTPLLEAKNALREQGVFHTDLFAFTTEAKYFPDLQTICTEKVKVDRPEYILEHFGGEEFDFILLGRQLNTYREPFRLLDNLLQLLRAGGQLLLKLKNTFDIGTLLRITGVELETDKAVVQHMSLTMLNNCLRDSCCSVKDVTVEPYRIDENIKNMLENVVFHSENAYIRAIARDFIVNVVRNF